MKKGFIKYKKHPIHMVGRVWIFPEVTYVKDAEGELGIRASELLRLQLGVANALCGEVGPLRKVELDFLCEQTETSAKNISELLSCNVSSIVKWRKKDSVPLLESLFLREYFWIKLFGDKVSFPKTQVGTARLKALSKTAIDQHAAVATHTKAA
jgi:hypothetical protein